MIEKDDNTLVSEVLNGNTDSFEILICRYQSPLNRYLLKAVKDSDTAKDILQDVFIKAYEKLGTFNPGHKFFSWIYRIAVNESINHLRHESRFDSFSDEENHDAGNNPSEIIEEKELAKQIDNALSMLNPDFKILVILKHYQGFSYKEMSEITGLAEKKVKSRLYMARQILKEILINKI
jgi:RNA polymerase sigma-70 factor (ECF subfamily)